MQKKKKTANRLLALLLSVMMIVGMLPMTAFAAQADLTIETPEQFQSFAEQVNGGDNFEGKTVALAADINLGGENSPWTPIGTSSNPFKGTFDGGNHVVSGLYIDTGSNIGLFGYVDGGTVQNLTVQGEVKGSSAAAGVVGYLNGGTVKNCGNQTSVSAGSNVGGVVGSANGTCEVSGCYNAGAVSGTTGYIGGVVGYVWGTATITESYNTGSITGPATVGGIAGGHKAKAVNCENCYNAGTIKSSGSNNIGAIVGATRNGSVVN